jgi:vancomycin resistance protein YoaR
MNKTNSSGTNPSVITPGSSTVRVGRKRHLVAAAMAISSITLLTFVAIGLYLRDHTLAPVSVAGLPTTHMVSSPRLVTELTASASVYRLALQTTDGKITKYSLADMGLTADIPGTILAAEGQHVDFWHTLRVPLKLHIDQSKYVAFLREHSAQATVPATDATLTMSDGKVTIVPEKDGSGNRVANAFATVMTTAANLDSQPLHLNPGPIRPYITTAALQADKTSLEKVLRQHIALNIGKDNITPSANDIASWLILTPDYATSSIKTTVNREVVRQYLETVVAPYTNAPADTVTPTGDDGSVSIIEQSGGGTFTNEDEVVDNLSGQLLKAKDQQVTIAISGSTPKTVKSYSHPKWLIVNLTTKRIYAYEGTNLVRSFLVSAGAPATPTVQGTYQIYAKYASQDMRGLNADGTNYFQPNVQYVNYFYKDYAVHGNYWRPLSYFGSVNSSHGCVGIVNRDAAWVYSWAPIGTTVVVHA